MRLQRLHRAASDQDGFTLAEMLVVLAILGVVLAGLTALFTSGLKTQIDQTNRTRAQQDARLGLDKLRREIRCASTLSPTGSPTSSVTITLPSYCPTGGGTVTWCTKDKNGTSPPAPGAQPYTLWRYTGSASCSLPGSPDPGTKWASNLVDSTSPSVATGQIFDATVAPPVSTGPTSLTTPVTLPAATIDVGSTASFNSGPNGIIIGSSGVVSCAGTESARFTGCSGGQPGPYAAGTPVNSASTAAGPQITLSVSLAVDATPADTRQRFTLSDDIVLRNS